MSDPNSSPQRGSSPETKSGKTNASSLLLAALLLGAAVGLYLITRPPGQGGKGPIEDDGGGEAVSSLRERLDLTRTALEDTENLEMVDADRSWSALFQQSANDRAVALNRAINRVLRVDQLSAQATNASLDDEKRKSARFQLPDAISDARQAIDAFAAVSEDEVMPIWLRSRIDLHEASLLPGSMTKSLRKKVYQQLSDAIAGEVGKEPAAIILGGTLIQVVEQMEDPIDGLPDDILQQSATSIGQLSDQHDDNLFFALRAARLKITANKTDARRFVLRAQELTRAIEPSIRRETKPIGVTPDELVGQIIAAIDSENWSEAENRMLLWFNVLNSTEIVKTDRRRASPHPLDRLSFDSLRRLSAEMVAAAPLSASAGEITFNGTAITDSENIELIRAIDYDLDLDPDLVSVDADGLLQLWSNGGANGWSNAGELDLGMQPTGVIVADLFLVDSSNPNRLRADRKKPADGQEADYSSAARHNTMLNLVAFGPEGIRIIRVDGRDSATPESRLQLAEGETGLEQVKEVTAAVAGDLEADGDIDLVFGTEASGVRLFANRGNRTFFEILPASDFSVDDPISSMAIADLDRDLDLDVVTTHARSGKVGLIENLLHLQFRGRYLADVPRVEGAACIAVEDLDGNVSWDLIVGGLDTAIVFSQTAAANAWTVDRVETDPHEATHFQLADFDNDAWIDLVVGGSETIELSSLGPWGFGPWKDLKAGSVQTLSAAEDFDRDGSIDLAAVGETKVNVLENRTSSPGHHVDVRFKGIDDNASGRVNHFAIGSVLELRFGPHYRARIVTSPSTHFGIDGFDSASSVRAILPNGLTQTIRDPKIDSLVEEEQTLKGSCPYLYAWDGEKFVFQTDCLWAAPLGLQVARGVVAKDRPWEYLKIDGANIKPRDDCYEFRITEELWEIAYFDKVALTVIDRPADVEVWTNEKVGPGEIATPTVFAFRKDQLHPVTLAVDTVGRDVTARLADADRNFVKGFDRRLRQGLCEPHWIDLDFGNVALAADESVYLVMTGWILPTDTSLNIQIDQNPDLGPIEFPSVWVPDDSEPGGWQKSIPYMGFPGGENEDPSWST